MFHREILDDDARFGKSLGGLLIDKHGKLAQRRHPYKALARFGILQVDQFRFERNAAFIKGDQRLPAIGRERVVIEAAAPWSFSSSGVCVEFVRELAELAPSAPCWRFRTSSSPP